MKYAIYDTEDAAEEGSKHLGATLISGASWPIYSYVVLMPDGKFGFSLITEGKLKADHLVAETLESEEIPIPEEILLKEHPYGV